jgi:hypothetical protein
LAALAKLRVNWLQRRSATLELPAFSPACNHGHRLHLSFVGIARALCDWLQAMRRIQWKIAHIVIGLQQYRDHLLLHERRRYAWKSFPLRLPSLESCTSGLSMLL